MAKTTKKDNKFPIIQLKKTIKINNSWKKIKANDLIKIVNWIKIAKKQIQSKSNPSRLKSLANIITKETSRIKNKKTAWIIRQTKKIR